MALWNSAYEEASASLRSSPRASPRPHRVATRSQDLTRELSASPRVDATTVEHAVVAVGSPWQSEPVAPAGRTRLLGFGRSVVDSRSTSPVRQSLPRVRSTSRGAAWRGNLIDDVAARPLAARGQGGVLSLHAAEREARWGSLRRSWEVKNAFEAWRVCLQATGEDRRVVVFDDSDKIRELELLVAQKDRLLLRQEQQLSDVNAFVDVERRRQADVLKAIGGISLKTELTPVLDALTTLRAEVQTQGKALQDFRAASSEQSLALRRGFETSERATAELLRGLLSEIRAELTGAMETLSDRLRTDFAAKSQTSTREILSAVAKSEEEVSAVRSDLRWLQQETKDIKQTLASVQSGVSKLDTDPSRVLAAISTSTRDVVDAMRGGKPDMAPILHAIHGLRIPDNSEVLAAVRGIREPDFSPVLAAIRKLPADLDLPSMSDQISKSLDKALSAVDSSSSRLSKSIQGLSAQPNHASLLPAINKIVCELRQDTLDAVATNVRTSLEPVIRAIASADVDFEPILASIRKAKAEIQATTTATLQKVSSGSIQVHHTEAPQVTRKLQMQKPYQARVQQAPVLAMPRAPPAAVVQPVFAAWRQAVAPRRRAMESQIVPVMAQPVEAQIAQVVAQPVEAQTVQVVPQFSDLLAPAQPLELQFARPQTFEPAIMGQAQARAASMPGLRSRRYVTNWNVGTDAPSLSPRSMATLESPCGAVVDMAPRPASVTTVMSQPRSWEEAGVVAAAMGQARGWEDTSMTTEARFGSTTTSQLTLSPRSYGGIQ